jgi:replication factor C large subunit
MLLLISKVSRIVSGPLLERILYGGALSLIMSSSRVPMDTLSWIEKYRPRNLDELVGHNKIAEQMRSWARNWAGDSNPKLKALILEGEPGVGKTTAALALANEMEWEVIELNASDARNLESIRRMATRGAMSRDITDLEAFSSGADHKRKMILLDEADNLYERGVRSVEGPDLSDKGGKRAIVELVRLTKQPVILVVNNLYGLISGAGASLSFTCEKLKFRRLAPASIVKRLRHICQLENIHFDEEILHSIAERSGGDMRSAVGDLQMVSVGKTRITVKDMVVLGLRDNKENIFNTLDKVFRADSVSNARKALMDVDENIDALMLWFAENVTAAMSHPEDIDRGLQRLSKADVYLGRVRRRQNYKLWKYAKDTIAAMSIARRYPNRNRIRYQFPSYLKSMSRTKDTRATLKETALLLGRFTHTSIRTIKEDPIYRFGLLVKREPEFAAHLVADVGLKKEHLKMVSKGTLNDKEIKSIIKDAEKYQSEQAAPKPIETSGLMAYHSDEEEIEEEVKEQEPEEAPSEEESEESSKQTSLFEF